MKKSVAIIIGIGIALAIVLIGIFGVAPQFQDQKVPVTSITINQKNQDNSVVLDYDNGQRTVDLTWAVAPYEATDKSVTVTTNDENIQIGSIVGNAVTITVLNETIGRVFVTANDGSEKFDYIDVVAVSTATVSVSYDFSTNSVLNATQGAYSVEEGKVVLFNGRSYIFDFAEEIGVVDTNDVVDFDGSLIEAKSTGTFTIGFTSGEDTKTLEVEVVDYLSAFSFIGGYQNYLTATAMEATTYLDKAQMYEIGAGNVFKMGLLVKNRNNVTISEFEKTFSLKEFVDGEYVDVVNPSVYVSETEDNKAWFIFTQAAVGKQLQLTVSPKYSSVSSRTMEFVVNDGVNIYSHQELDEAFEMKGAFLGVIVNRINIHDLIQIVVGDENKYTVGDREGYLVNEDSYADLNDLGEEDLVADHGKTGHIYYRDASQKNISVEVVGNYQTIDGANIPMMVNSTGDNELEEAGKHIAVQSSIFRFTGHGTGEFSMRNLKVVGNTRTAASEEGTNLSGGIILVHIDTNGQGTYENLNLSDGVIGLFLTSGSAQNTARKLTIKDTYNSAVLLWNGNLSIYASLISSSGGPSIQLVDSNANFDSELQPESDPDLVIDQSTLDNIENWVAGDEGWFAGMNLQPLVSQMKTQINAATTGFGKTILKTDEENETITYVNFKLFIQNDNPVTSTVPTQGTIVVVPSEGENATMTSDRPYNFYTNFAAQNYTYLGAVDANPYNFAAENVEIVTAVPATGSQIVVFLEWLNVQ